MSDKIENHLLVGRRYRQNRISKNVKLVAKGEIVKDLDEITNGLCINFIYTNGQISNGKPICTSKRDEESAKDISDFNKITEITINFSLHDVKPSYTITARRPFAFDTITKYQQNDILADNERYRPIGQIVLDAIKSAGMKSISTMSGIVTAVLGDAVYYGVHDGKLVTDSPSLQILEQCLGIDSDKSSVSFDSDNFRNINLTIKAHLGILKRISKTFKSSESARKNMNNSNLDFLYRLFDSQFSCIELIHDNVKIMFKDSPQILQQEGITIIAQLIDIWQFYRSKGLTHDSITELLNLIFDKFVEYPSYLSALDPNDIDGSIDSIPDIDYRDTKDFIVTMYEDLSEAEIKTIEDHLNNLIIAKQAKYIEGEDDISDSKELPETKSVIDPELSNHFKRKFFGEIIETAVIKQLWSDTVINKDGSLHSLSHRGTLYHRDTRDKCISICSKAVTVVWSSGLSKIYELPSNEVCPYVTDSEMPNVVSLILITKDPSSDLIREGFDRRKVQLFTLYTLNLSMLTADGDSKLPLTKVYAFAGKNCCLMNPLKSRHFDAALLLNEFSAGFMIQPLNSTGYQIYDFATLDKAFAKGKYLSQSVINQGNDGEFSIERKLKEGIGAEENDEEANSNDKIDMIQRVPHIRVKGRDIFAISPGGDGFRLYWVRHRSDRLELISEHDDMSLQASDIDSSFDAYNSNYKELSMSYIEALDNLVEKITWFEFQKTPSLAVAKQNFTIDLFLMHNNKIIKCKGLKEPWFLGKSNMPKNIEILDRCQNKKESSDLSEDVDDEEEAEKRKYMLKNSSFGWDKKTQCLILTVFANRSEYMEACKDANKLTIKTFQLKF